MFFHRRGVILVAFIAGLLVSSSFSHASGPSFSVSFARSRSDKPLDGRIFLLLSNDPSAEPRMQIDDSVRTQMIFGVDVEGMQPDQAIIVDDSAAGYPILHLRDVPPGEFITCRPCCIATKPFTARTGTPSSSPWIAAKVSTGTLRRAISIPLRGKSPWGRPPDRFPFSRRPGNCPHRAAAGHEIHSPHQNSECAAHQILGTADVSQRQPARARRI